MNEYAARLKEVIKNSVLSQKDVATLVGVTPTAVNLWLNGERNIELNKLLEILEAIKEYAGDHKRYVIEGIRPEDEYEQPDLEDVYIKRSDVPVVVKDFLFKMKSTKNLIILGDLDEMMKVFASRVMANSSSEDQISKDSGAQ